MDEDQRSDGIVETPPEAPPKLAPSCLKIDPMGTVVFIEFDPEKQCVLVDYDREKIKTLDFVLGILEMARKQVELRRQLVIGSNIQKKQQEEFETGYMQAQLAANAHAQLAANAGRRILQP